MQSVLWKTSLLQVILTDGLNRSWSTSLSLNILCFHWFHFRQEFCFICFQSLLFSHFNMNALNNLSLICFLVYCIPCKNLTGYKTPQINLAKVLWTHESVLVQIVHVQYMYMCIIISAVHLAKYSSFTFFLLKMCQCLQIRATFCRYMN